MFVCAALLGTPSALAQQNLGFEALDAATAAPLGWTATLGADTAVLASDERVAVEGLRSLRLDRSAPAGATRVVQRVAATELGAPGDARALRVRLRGMIRAEPTVSPALWLRIDGPRGPLFLDSFGGREADGASVAPPSGTDDRPLEWRLDSLELPLPADVEEVAFGVSAHGQGTAWFDGLELTLTATDGEPEPSPAARQYLEAALELMREHSLRRQEVDWATVQASAVAHARGARFAADTHVAVRFAVRELGDRHSYLQSPAASRALAAAAVSNARTGVPPAAPVARRLDQGLGYVAVPGFAGGTSEAQVQFAENVNNLVQQIDIQGVCGWIVDLRRNSGGNLWPMLAGLGALLGEGEVAASVYPDGRRVPVWHRNGQAGFGEYVQLRVRTPYRLRADAPVAVLLGPGTASSAEVLAVAFDGRASSRSFGAPTRGLSAGNRTFDLRDGASLVLTVAATSGRDGRLRLGPVAPDVAIAPTSGGPGDDGALRAAADWLAGGDSCR